MKWDRTLRRVTKRFTIGVSRSRLVARDKHTSTRTVIVVVSVWLMSDMSYLYDNDLWPKRKIDMSDIHITPFPELRLNTMVGYMYRYTSMSIVTDWYLISICTCPQNENINPA